MPLPVLHQESGLQGLGLSSLYDAIPDRLVKNVTIEY